MERLAAFALGMTVGLGITLFTSLLTELILGGALAFVLTIYGRKRWSTHSTTKPSQSSSPSPTDLL